MVNCFQPELWWVSAKEPSSDRSPQVESTCCFWRGLESSSQNPFGWLGTLCTSDFSESSRHPALTSAGIRTRIKYTQIFKKITCWHCAYSWPFQQGHYRVFKIRPSPQCHFRWTEGRQAGVKKGEKTQHKWKRTTPSQSKTLLLKRFSQVLMKY